MIPAANTEERKKVHHDLTRIFCVKKRRRIRFRFELTMIIAAIKKKGRVQFKLTMISEANK